MNSLKTVYQSVDWSTYNNQLKGDGWVFVKNDGKDYNNIPYIRISKQVPNTIYPLIEPYKEYIESITKYSLRYLLSPISDFDWLCGPFYDYYCLIDIRLTSNSWLEHTEYPFTVWCHGSDDLAWYGLYKTRNECDEILDYLEEEVDMPSLHDFFEAYQLKYM